MRARCLIGLWTMVAVMACTGESLAAWRDEHGPFRIGIVAEAGAGRSVAGLASLRQAYARAIGMPVEIFVARDYAALIDAQASSRVDYAVYSAAAYATAWLLCHCVEPVAAPIGSDGATGLRLVMIARDGKVGSLADAASHRIAMVSPNKADASFPPLNELADAGLVVSDASAFAVPAGSPGDAERLLIDGAADAMLGWIPASGSEDEGLAGGTLARLEAAGMEPASLAVVWKSKLVRYGPHVVRNDVDAGIKTLLAAFLGHLKESQPDIYDLVEDSHGGGFVATSHADYESVIATVAAIQSTR